MQCGGAVLLGCDEVTGLTVYCNVDSIAVLSQSRLTPVHSAVVWIQLAATGGASQLPPVNTTLSTLFPVVSGGPLYLPSSRALLLTAQ